MNTQKEIWKDVPNYDGCYQVSNLGRVKSLKYSRELILKHRTSVGGYDSVSLCLKGKACHFSVHSLVAITFLNHNHKLNGLVVDHINNNRSDNNLSNIQIITQRENASKNQINRSSNYTGVYWNRSKQRFISQISLNGKNVFLGAFRKKEEKEASRVYQCALRCINKFGYIPLHYKNF